MLSIFSTYEPVKGTNDEEILPSEVYKRLRIAYNQGAKAVPGHRMFLRTVDECEELYEIWRNKELQDICKWANEKIVLQLGKLDYRTIGVRLSIFTNMLNILTYNNELSKQMNIIIHDAFVNNVQREMSAINTEDLPF